MKDSGTQYDHPTNCFTHRVSNWGVGVKIEKPIKREKLGCLCCGFKGDVLPMEKMLAVGFGDVTVEMDGKHVYSENSVDEFWTTQDAENKALENPDADWRIHFYGPLWGGSFQRQSKGHWILYREDMGFA